MRKIRFRAKSLYTNTFVYGYYYVDPRDGSQCVTSTGISQTIDVETLGQYTGLKDKNGKEIYEGDILRINKNYPNYRFSKGRILIVSWFNAKTAFGCTFLGEIKEDLYPIKINPEYEVIGNIHDNPELLQAK